MALAWVGSVCADDAIKGGCDNQLLSAQERPQVAGAEKINFYKNQYGYIACDTAEEAANMFKDMEKAVATFKTRFGREPGKGLFVKFKPEIKNVMGELMRKLECVWLIPCIPQDSLVGLVDDNQLRAAIRGQIKEQLPQLADEKINEIVEQNFPEVRKQILQQVGRISINTHELGHMLLMGAYWPDYFVKTEDRKSQYGGPAADWLDEAAAILLEDSAIVKSRWETIKEVVQKNFAGFVPLEQLVKMNHPAKENKGGDADDQQGESASGSVEVTVGVRAISEDGGGPEAGANFYAQICGFADFLIETTGKKDIFGSIAENEANGSNFESWLKKNAATYKLPPTLPELDQQFRGWLVAKFKPAATPAGKQR